MYAQALRQDDLRSGRKIRELADQRRQLGLSECHRPGFAKLGGEGERTFDLESRDRVVADEKAGTVNERGSVERHRFVATVKARHQRDRAVTPALDSISDLPWGAVVPSCGLGGPVVRIAPNAQPARVAHEPQYRIERVGCQHEAS